VTASRPPQSGQEIRPPSDTRIGRIVAAVDPKFVPAGLDYSALEKITEIRVNNYRETVKAELRPKHYEPHIERRRRVIEKAQELIAAVEEMDGDDWVGWEQIEKETNEEVIFAIEDLVSRSEHSLEELEDWVGWSKSRYGSKRDLFSPIHWLVGCWLPKAFEDHFKWRSTTEEGPCVSFVLQVLVEYDITNKDQPYKPPTISRMIRDVRNNRFRRQDKPDDPEIESPF
jgi:hypothetical protein